jgi:molybdenum cofactor cytidylyltransferase
MAVSAARHLVQGVAAAIAVVRPGDEALARLLEDEGLGIVTLPDADRGMGASLAAGIAATQNALGWVIALADMPFIRPETVREIAACLSRGAPLVTPAYRGRRGHPVGLAARYRATLLALQGEVGARALLERESARLWTLATDDPGVITDIDTPEDLARVSCSGVSGSEVFRVSAD